jgi:hypothetical protein
MTGQSERAAPVRYVRSSTASHRASPSLEPSDDFVPSEQSPAADLSPMAPFQPLRFDDPYWAFLSLTQSVKALICPWIPP